MGIAAASPAAAASRNAAAVSAQSAASQAGGAPSGSVADLELSNATQQQLLGLYAGYRGIPASDIAGIARDSVHGAQVVATGQEWAMVTFIQSVNAPQSVLVGFQDGGSTGIFSRAPGGPWTMSGVAGLPAGCGPLLSAAIRQLWGISDCVSGPSAQVQQASPLTTGDVAQIALNSVGVADNPPSTDFDASDCNPFTTIEVGDISSSGCGSDSTFDVTNESLVWCANFAKWVWTEAGVTADLSTLQSLSSNFYTWGTDQGEQLTVDGTNPQVGDAVVFYPGKLPTAIPHGPTSRDKGPEKSELTRDGAHVGIVTGVNPNGTVDIVNGDFLAGSNIEVHYDADVSIASWAAGIWGQGATWLYVSPNLPVPSPENVSTTADTTWDDLFQSYGDSSGAWNGGDGAQSVQLPDGNTAWFFSDTYLGQVDPDGTRPPLSTGIAHNSAVVYSTQGGTLGPTEAGSPGSGGYSFLGDYTWVPPPSAYPAPQYELINGDQVLDSGTVYKFYQLADTSIHPNNFQYMLVGTVLESFAVNGNTLTPEGGTVLGTPASSESGNPIIWGAAVLESGGYVYIYGTRPYNTPTAPSPDAYPLYVARVPVGDLSAGTADWQYYDYGASCNPPADAWSSSSADPTALMPGGASAGFSVTDVNGTYVLLTNNTTGTVNNQNVGAVNDAVAYYADCPTGFSASSPQFTIYQPDVPSGYLTYEYRIVPQFSSGSHVLVSYSQDTEREDASCLGENYYDAAVYRPQFLDVLLPDINGGSGNITEPPFDPPPTFSSPPVSPDPLYTPTQDYPGTQTEMQNFCTDGASPLSSPVLTSTNDADDVIDLNWTLQPSAMWLYSVVYCDVTYYGSQCPSNLVGSAGDNLAESIPACSDSAASNQYCGHNLSYGTTSSTLVGLIPNDLYEIQVETTLAVEGGVYVGSNVLTEQASGPQP